MATATELFSDYNYYRLFTGHVAEARASGKWIRYLKETPERLAALAAMSAWCCDRGYSSRHWLCWLFYRNHWKYARPFHQLVPGSKRTEKAMVSAYQACRFLAMYDRRMRELGYDADVAAGAIYDGNRDMAASTEALKRRYMMFSDPDGCLSDLRTNGYHPRSVVCGQCPLAGRCEQNLRAGAVYDIVALRNGAMTAEQAKHEAWIRGK
jgi:hypothetical protein